MGKRSVRVLDAPLLSIHSQQPNKRTVFQPSQHHHRHRRWLGRCAAIDTRIPYKDCIETCKSKAYLVFLSRCQHLTRTISYEREGPDTPPLNYALEIEPERTAHNVKPGHALFLLKDQTCSRPLFSVTRNLQKLGCAASNSNTTCQLPRSFAEPQT